MKSGGIKISEAEIMRSIGDLLAFSKLKNIYWRVALGGIPHTISGKTIYKANPMKGHFDFEGFTPKGIFWAMEVKTAKGRLSEAQVTWQDIIHKNHGAEFAQVIRSAIQAQIYIQFLEQN